jgi:hypothetical protein
MTAEGEILHRLRDGRFWRGRPVPVDEALAHAGPDIVLITVASGQAASYELQARIERWAQAGGTESWPCVDLALRSRVIWSPTRAAVIGPSEAMGDAVPAVLLQSWLAAETSGLEQEVDEIWPALDADSRLTHAVSRRDLREQKRVNVLTRQVTGLRGRRIWAERMVDRPDAGLTPPSRRLFLELARQSEIADRLEGLEDPIEFAQDLYESANDRLTEFRYFSTELRVEWLILAVLALELAAIVVDWLT